MELDKKKQGYLKRFCFRMPYDVRIEEQISPSLKRLVGAEFESNSGIENFEVFTVESSCLFVLDVRLHINWSDFISGHKEQMAVIGNKYGLDEIIMLERIFKKEPGKKHVAKTNDEYKRTVMTLELKNDTSLLKEYKEIHHPQNIWPQVIRNMDIMGIHDMEIYLQNYQAFLIMDTDPDFDLEKDGQRWANLPREKEWQHYVAKFQKVDPRNSALEKWKEMKLSNKK